MFIEHLCKNTCKVKKHLENEKQNEMIIPKLLKKSKHLLRRKFKTIQCYTFKTDR